jgi:hypothetical protein
MHRFLKVIHRRFKCLALSSYRPYFVSMHVRMRVCLTSWVCMFVCIHVWIYVCICFMFFIYMFLCMCSCKYTYIHIGLHAYINASYIYTYADLVKIHSYIRAHIHKTQSWRRIQTSGWVYMLRSCFDLIACIRSTFGNGWILSRFFSFILTSNKVLSSIRMHMYTYIRRAKWRCRWHTQLCS